MQEQDSTGFVPANRADPNVSPSYQRIVKFESLQTALLGNLRPHCPAL